MTTQDTASQNPQHDPTETNPSDHGTRTPEASTEPTGDVQAATPPQEPRTPETAAPADREASAAPDGPVEAAAPAAEEQTPETAAPADSGMIASAPETPADETSQPEADGTDASATEATGTPETAEETEETQAQETPQATETGSEAESAETPEAHPLRHWWAEAEFPGKEFCTLKDNNDLYLTATAGGKEKFLAHLNLSHAPATVRALVTKFADIWTRVQELETEWNATEDKLKLAGKVARTHDYLDHTHAIGNFAELQQKVKAWDTQVNDVYQKHYGDRLALVEQAEALTNQDNWKEATQGFQEIAEKWKQTGVTDKARADELWNRMEAARDKFFERKRQRQENQERDMLSNLDQKMEVVEKAEAYAAADRWKEGAEGFKTLMEQWKAIGPTMHDKNEELWQRFMKAKNTFFDRRKANSQQMRSEQETSYQTKLQLVEKAEALQDSTDWGATAQAYNDLMEQWKQAGRAPAEKSDEVWSRFLAAKEKFFDAKRNHSETFKVTLNDNLAQKKALLQRAEAIKTSRQWRETTDEMNEMMTEWKKIGPVPKEHSQILWEAFIGARNYFFEQKDESREKRKEYVGRQQTERAEQTRRTASNLEAELREERERLEDFRQGLENITPGKKAEELRAHLTTLISETEQKIKQKEQKLSQQKAG